MDGSDRIIVDVLRVEDNNIGRVASGAVFAHDEPAVILGVTTIGAGNEDWFRVLITWREGSSRARTTDQVVLDDAAHLDVCRLFDRIGEPVGSAVQPIVDPWQFYIPIVELGLDDG